MLYDVVDQTTTNTKFLCEAGVPVHPALVSCANICDLYGSEFCILVQLSAQGDARAGRDCTALVLPIMHVLSVIGSEEMVGPDAIANVAAVADERAFGDGAVLQQVRHAVSTDALSLIGKLPVPIRNDRGTPQPTCVGFLDFAPESFHAMNHTKLVRSIP